MGVQVLALEEKPSVCVCGAGNAAQAFMAYLSSRGYEVNVFVDRGNKAEMLQEAMETYGGLTVLDRTDPSNIREIKGAVTRISNNPAEILPFCDIVIFALTSNAFRPVMESIRPHVKDGAIIYCLPGQGGADLVIRQVMKDEFATGKITFASVMPLPFNCRIREFGKLVDLAAVKDQYDLAAFPQKNAVVAGALLKDLLGRPVNVTGSMAALHLLGANPNIHPARMFGLWGDWDGQTPYAENPLFYETWDDKSAELAEGICRERCGVWSEIVSRSKGVAGKITDVKPLREYILQCYGDQIADCSTTKGVFATNDGYKGFRCPMKQENGGWVPDFENRYFTEDFPESFAIYKGLADMVDYPTPIIDTCFFWAQRYMGREYITGEVGSARLNGKDAWTTKAPQAFGVHTLDEFLGTQSSCDNIDVDDCNSDAHSSTIRKFYQSTLFHESELKHSA